MNYVKHHERQGWVNIEGYSVADLLDLWKDREKDLVEFFIKRLKQHDHVGVGDLVPILSMKLHASGTRVMTTNGNADFGPLSFSAQDGMVSRQGNWELVMRSTRSDKASVAKPAAKTALCLTESDMVRTTKVDPPVKLPAPPAKEQRTGRHAFLAGLVIVRDIQPIGYGGYYPAG